MHEAHLNKSYSSFVVALLLLFPVVINSVKILGNLILLILVLIGAYIAIKEQQNPFKIPELKLLSWITVGYFLIMLLSILIANGINAEFHHLGRKLHFLLAPLVALTIYRANLSIQHLLLSLKIGLILIGIVTLVQFVFGHPRPSGMINANIFGDLAVAMFFLSIVRVFKENRQEQLLSLVASTLGLTAIILSASRGSWLSFLILAVIYLIIIYPQFLKGYRKRQVSFLLLISIILGVVVPQTSMVQKVSTAINNIQDWQEGDAKFSSSGVRMEMWKSGVLAAADAPWFGYGYRNANEVAAKYAIQNHERITGFTHLHNEYITNLVSAGFVGLMSLLTLLLVPLIMFIRKIKSQKQHHYALMGVMLCVGYITFGFTHIAFGEEHVNAFYVLFLSILLPAMGKTQASLFVDKNL